MPRHAARPIFAPPMVTGGVAIGQFVNFKIALQIKGHVPNLASAAERACACSWIRSSMSAARELIGPLCPEETDVMSKGMDQKKQDKKKPAKSLKEKRAEKQAKRASRG